jgi:hypothetical protein
MEAFTFASPLLGAPLVVRQQAAGQIGFKIYPGALLAVRLLEDAVAGRGTHGAAGAAVAAALSAGGAVVELGAGVCGLPSLVLGARRVGSGGHMHAVATDVPAALPLLRANAEAAVGSGGGSGSSPVTVAPLTWGDPADVPALVERLRSASSSGDGGGGAAPPPVCSLLLGADVVYHEPLIDPLLTALRELTAQGVWGGPAGATGDAATPPPPQVLLTYVQRFKRAKAFFKKARRWFDVAAVPLGSVVDYEALTWNRHEGDNTPAAAGADGGGQAAPLLPALDSGSADYERYLRGVCAAADAKREREDEAAATKAAASGGDEADASAGPAAPAAAAAVVYHAVDSDSLSDDPGKAPGLGLFAGVDTGLGAAAGGSDDDGGGDGDGRRGDSPAQAAERRRLRELRASATAAAAYLGLPALAEPLEAYAYVLTRRA